jgi:hypothetical protein
MPQAKTIHSKNSKKLAAHKPSPRIETPEEDLDSPEIPLVTKKVMKEVELEDDEVLPLAEKVEDTSLFGDPASSDEESAEDEADIDEEELNPFGDKWEV